MSIETIELDQSASVDWNAAPGSEREREIVHHIANEAQACEVRILHYRSSIRQGSEATEFEGIVAGIVCSLVLRPSENGCFSVDYSKCSVPFDAETEPAKGSNDPRYIVNLLSQQQVGFVEAVLVTDEGNGFDVVNTVRATADMVFSFHEPAMPKQATGDSDLPTAVEEGRQAKNTVIANAPAASAHANPLDYFRLLDVHRWSDNPEVNAFVDAIFTQLKATSGNENKRKKHLKVILLDLYLAWSDDPELKIAYHRGVNAYKTKSRYNRIHISKLTPEVVDWLIDAGYVDHAIGFFDHETGRSRLSRMWSSRKLIDLFEKAKFGPLDIVTPEGREVIVLRQFNAEKERQFDIEYDDTPDTEQMRASVMAYNRLLWRTFIDIPELETPAIDLGPSHGAHRTKLVVSQVDKFSRRIFNRSSWEKGGRFYGGWWQRCPSEWRKRIFINDGPTNEIDYSGLHMVMLYALAGRDYWTEVGTDPYSLELPILGGLGVSPRSVCKQLVLVALNAKDDKEAFGAFRAAADDGSPEKRMSNGVLTQVLDALRNRHAPIADKFASDAGIDLMNFDSQITERLIEQFTAEGIPILSVHDSYIVPVGAEKKLLARMHLAFGQVMQGAHARAVPARMIPGIVHPKHLTLDEVAPLAGSLLARFRPPTKSKRYLANLRRFDEWRQRTRGAEIGAV